MTVFWSDSLPLGHHTSAAALQCAQWACARLRVLLRAPACVCVFVCRWTGGRERGEDRWLREASEASARGCKRGLHVNNRSSRLRSVAGGWRHRRGFVFLTAQGGGKVSEIRPFIISTCRVAYSSLTVTDRVLWHVGRMPIKKTCPSFSSFSGGGSVQEWFILNNTPRCSGWYFTC